MPEEPEDVLPEERVTALGGIEEMGIDKSIHRQEAAVDCDGRQGENHHYRHYQHRQTKSGIRFNDIPGARCLKVVTMIWVAAISPAISVKVMVCAQIRRVFR